jgi:glycosyltransferase involved in cell wall biosynthesis
MENKLFVAIWMVTYNHEKYIEQAIESVMIQKTNFNYKLFLGEDCSTDNTKEICEKLKKKYPEKIELYLNKVNIGANNNAQQIYNVCFNSGAKYIAMLEGDDYWTDPLKLQKQVDFLEANSGYVCCLTQSLVGDSDKNTVYSKILIESDILGHQILNESYFATNTFVFRNNIIDYSSGIFKESPLGDTLILYLLSLKGKVKYLPLITGFYRKHSGGFYSGTDGIVIMERQKLFYNLLLKYGYLKHKVLLNSLIQKINFDMAYNYAFRADFSKSLYHLKSVNWKLFLVDWKKTIKIIFYLIKSRIIFFIIFY